MEIKFLNNKKNKIIVVGAFVLILLMLLFFLVTYVTTHNLNKFSNNVNFVNRNGYESALKNITRELVVVSENSDGEFFEKSRMKLELSDLNKIFTDMYPIGKYEIIDFNDNSIVLKEIDNMIFDPNTYYIGENNGYITVFKSDNAGNLFIENESTDISSKTVESLPIADRDLVMNYELKSSEREEVENILSELET